MADSQDQTVVATVQEAPLSPREKFWVGFLLISFTLISLFMIIGYWPDRIAPLEGRTYTFTMFHVELIKAPGDDNGTTPQAKHDVVPTQQPAASQPAAAKPLTDQQKDSAAKAVAAKTAPKPAVNKTAVKPAETKDEGDTIQLNSLLLILVALGGFLGNMVNIGPLFTTFVGIAQFKRSWILWYIIKPFTAAGLALFVYFALNSDPGTSATLNLNTIMATATLTGLFTDLAMLRLRKFFEAAVNQVDRGTGGTTADGRQSKPAPPAKPASVDVDKIKPAKIDPKNPNAIEIPGENLNKDDVIVTIDGKPVD